MTALIDDAKKLGQTLISRQLALVTAESCTGGGIAALITDIAGASQWFERGLVTYSNLAKIELLGIEPDLIEQYGAVSHETAKAMALGALANKPGRVALSVTGIAGPDGGTADKPVGTVFIGVASDALTPLVKPCLFSGDRHAIRQQTIKTALSTTYHYLNP